MSIRNGLRRARRLARHAESELMHDSGLRRNLMRSMGLASSTAPPIAYLGFAGRGNAGDDAILLAHRRSLDGARVGLLPLERERQVLTLLGRSRRRPLHRGVLVGGGTLVGRHQWRRRLELALEAQAGPVAFTGVGVEEPGFQGATRPTDEEELRRWIDILGGAAHLSVRGPRSAALLRAMGIDASVVSDPALLLGPDDIGDGTVRSKLLGVNVADPEDQYRGTGTRVFDECVMALRKLQGSGWAIRLLPFDRKDLVLARALRGALSSGVDLVGSYSDVDALLGSIAECDVLIGQRLHSVVLAAAVSVPALAIDYRPKCMDFQLSIGRQDWTVSTLDISAAAVTESVVSLHEARAHHAAEIHAEVTRAKAVLRAGERRLERVFAVAAG